MIRKFSLVFSLLFALANCAGAIDFKFDESATKGISIQTREKADAASAAALPAGPLSVRIHNRSAWVADSLASRLVKANPDASISMIRLVSPDQAIMPGDMAFSKDAQGKTTWIWVINLNDNSLLRFTPRGQLSLKIGPELADGSAFSRLKLVETDSRGHVFVGDSGRQKIFELDQEGKPVKQFNWASSAFCLDKNGNLALALAEDDKWIIELINPVAGKKRTIKLPGLSKSANPQLWGFSNDRLVFSAWSGGPVGHFVGILDPDSGKTENQGSLGEIAPMLRYIALDQAGNIYRAIAGFKGSRRFLHLIRIALEGEAEG